MEYCYLQMNCRYFQMIIDIMKCFTDACLQIKYAYLEMNCP